MTTLAPIHYGLRKLRRLRTATRLGCAIAAAASVLLWVLAAAFVLDYWLRMGRLERGIMLGVLAATAGWVMARYLSPALRTRESDVDLALLVERQQGLSSDLVAAIQFADRERRQYGSGDLREAVIECTAEASDALDFLEGFDRRAITRRLGVLAISAVLLVLPAAIFPGHSRAFLQRLLMLAPVHYPTRTRIERIISPAGPAVAYGRDVVFRVKAGGEIPAAGVVEVRVAGSDVTTTVDLLGEAGEPTIFTGRLPRVLDNLVYVVRLGDAYTEPTKLTLIPPPLVKVDLDVTPPAYTLGRSRDRDGDQRRLVPEGSRVRLRVSADRPLAGGKVALDTNEHPLQPGPDGALSLDPAGTPLDRLTENVRYRVSVTDKAGLGPQRPISGMVQVLPDRPPRVSAGAVTQYVLPTATPRIVIRAADDYGLARLLLHADITHADANSESAEWMIAAPPDRPGELALTHRLALSELKLTKGDHVQVTVEAVDYRGELPGRTASSQPLTFIVTDRRGLLESMRKLDDRAVEKLDQIIKAQLGIGP